MAEHVRRIRWVSSIQTKQLLGFAIIVALNMLLFYILQNSAIQITTGATYERMKANTNYYLNTLESEISHVHDLQIDFFNDRRLPFMVSPLIELTDYERREYLLSLRERLVTITGVSDLVDNGILLLPKSNYKITQAGVTRMSADDYTALQTYVEHDKHGLSYVESKLLLVETGVPRVQSDSLPNHVLIISFSPEMIRRSMASLNTTESSGAFIYWEAENLLLENTRGKSVASAICACLERDEAGKPIMVQRLLIGGDWYLVFTGETGGLGLFAQYVKEEPIMRSIRQIQTQMFFVLGSVTLMFAFFAMYTRKIIHEPLHILLNAFSEFKIGNWTKRIHHTGEDEFVYLYEGFNNMIENAEQLISEVYVQKNLAQRAQLKHLQAQINPHFLYNSFFALSRRVQRHDYKNAQELADHLGNYFRFLTRDASDFIMLREEVEHAKSYAAIQGSRFISRLTIQFGILPESFQSLMVPRLILQPLLENALEHGLENTIKDGLLRISFVEENNTLLIHVEDNGQEAKDSEIEDMQKMLDEGDDGEITGIRNIHRRLEIYFKGQGGLQVSRSSLGGVRVTVYIEKGEKWHEPESTDCG